MGRYWSGSKLIPIAQKFATIHFFLGKTRSLVVSNKILIQPYRLTRRPQTPSRLTVQVGFQIRLLFKIEWSILQRH